MKKRFFIGTSGWSYDHWEGVFYPPGLKQSERLGFYIRHFDTVEINNTFYRLPSEPAFERWKDVAPQGFIYSLKGSRYITHMKKLKDPREPLNLFIHRANIMGNTLGPILFQLPPRWKCNPSRLESFVRNLPKGIRFVFEFRDRTWFSEEVYEILRNGGTALCLYSMPGFETPVETTASFVYIRFHGSDILYGGRYSKDELKRWADIIEGFMDSGLDVYTYFNNDAFGNAVFNARELGEMIG